MQKFIIPFFLIFISFSSFAQNERKITLKNYMNVEVNSNHFLHNGLDAFYWTPAIAWSTKHGNSMEIEISHMKYRDYNIYKDEEKSELGRNEKNIELFLRYEYIFSFGQGAERKWRPSVGISVTPFYQYLVTSPYNLASFRYSSTKTGAYLTATPRIQYYVNQHWFLDLNLPISYASMEYSMDRNQNPTLTYENRSVSELTFNSWTGLGIRLGLGVVL